MDIDREALREKEVAEMHRLREQLLFQKPPGYQSRVTRIEALLYKLTGKRCTKPLTGTKRQRWNAAKRHQ